MTARNMSTASADVKEEEPPKETKEVKIRVSVFFDGTLNNQTNIDQRLVSSSSDQLTAEEQKTAAELKAKMSPEEIAKSKGIYKKYTGQGSYENGYTNVVKLERYIVAERSEGGEYNYRLKVYVEGPGTRDVKSDKMFGYAIGTGVSGVRKKVQIGIDKVVSNIRANHSDKADRIARLTLDVFGFSRGAAAARNFIHEALLESESVAERLKGNGFKVGEVEVQFAGLFDTVSSHGLSFANDVKALNLYAVSHAKKAIHLTAADEHRENFALTTIKSAGGKGKEIYLPGVHSDVGGSYRDGQPETQDVYWTMGENAREKAEQEMTRLVAAGWFTREELKLTESRLDRAGGKASIKEANLNGSRASISNMYSRIPLHLMARYAKEQAIDFKEDLQRDERVPDDLSDVKGKIDGYADSVGSSKPEDWHHNEEWLKKLRHRYFHFSARLEIGNGPNIVKGKRQRIYYDDV